MSPLLPRHYSVIDDNTRIADYGPGDSGSSFTTLAVNLNIVFHFSGTQAKSSSD